jgi:hypothetical protein
VTLNGVQTANIQHAKFAEGPLALQYGAGAKDPVGGPIKWRRVQVRPLEAEKPAAAAPKPVAGGGGAKVPAPR